MDFASLLVALFLYYSRPFEWIDLVAVLRPMMVIMLVALVSMVQRPGGFEIGSLVKTAHDRAMLVFFAYMIATSTDVGAALSDSLTLYGFYVVTAHALCTVRRLRLFLACWCGAMVGVVIMALLTLVGFDPLDSRHITDGVMRGRLVLNTSLLENPNALGHNVAPSVIALYYLLAWRGSPLGWVKWGISSLLVFLCIYQTQSKGSFLALGVAFVMGQIFGRPKLVQAALLIFALTAGTAGMKLMPRMEGLQDSRNDEGIQGRVEAFKFGLHLMRTHLTGAGMKRFPEEWRRAHGKGKTFATHSAYVGYGAELGRPGLALFLAIAYAGFRTLMFHRGISSEQDRIRRILYGLLVAHLTSCWMLTFQYHVPFFILAGCIGAYQRILLTSPSAVLPAAVGRTQTGKVPTPSPSRPPTQLVWAPDMMGGVRRSVGAAAALAPAAGIGVAPWNRFTKVDMLLVLVMLFGVEEFWKYTTRTL